MQQAVHSSLQTHPLCGHRWEMWVRKRNGRFCMRKTVRQPQTLWRFPISSPSLNTGEPFASFRMKNHFHNNQMNRNVVTKALVSVSVLVFKSLLLMTFQYLNSHYNPSIPCIYVYTAIFFFFFILSLSFPFSISLLNWFSQGLVERLSSDSRHTILSYRDYWWSEAVEICYPVQNPLSSNYSRARPGN